MTDVWEKITADFHKQCVSNFPISVFTDFVIRSMIPSMLGLSVSCVGGSAETMTTVDRLFPERMGEGPTKDEEEQAPHTLPERTWQVVPVKGPKALQYFDSAS